LDNQYNKRQHQKNVNEPTECVAAHETEQPQDQKDYKDRPKHLLTSRDLECFPERVLQQLRL
jgi:hypothetical protein